MTERPARPDVSVRPLAESDLPAADEIMRVAFGTFLGVPEPRTFMGDAASVQPRWRSNPTAAFAAELDGTLATAHSWVRTLQRAGGASVSSGHSPSVRTSGISVSGPK